MLIVDVWFFICTPPNNRLLPWVFIKGPFCTGTALIILLEWIAVTFVVFPEGSSRGGGGGGGSANRSCNGGGEHGGRGILWGESERMAGGCRGGKTGNKLFVTVVLLLMGATVPVVVGRLPIPTRPVTKRI